MDEEYVVYVGYRGILIDGFCNGEDEGGYFDFCGVG
ncbi:opine metallophore biosynthesis dehydrogenase [Staphylococcus epidermidis]|nr:opine metallophore biosynthesis dehydrogenase [Staphylococcus epidermidis]